MNRQTTLTLTISLVLISQIFDNRLYNFTPPLTISEIVSIIGAIIIFSLTFNKPFKTPVLAKIFVISLLIYALASSLSLFFSHSPINALRFFATNLMQCALAFLLLTATSIYPELLKRIFFYFGLFALAVALLNVLNAFIPHLSFLEARTHDPRTIGDFSFPTSRTVSITPIYGQLGVFVLIGALSIHGIAKTRHQSAALSLTYRSIVVLIVLAFVLSTQSRAIFLGLLSALPFLYYLSLPGKVWKAAIAIASIFLVLGIAIFTNIFYALYNTLITVKSGTAYRRIDQYNESISLIFENPLGIGHGAFNTTAGEGYVIHNTILDVFLSTGWLGGAAFCIVMAFPAIALVRYPQKDAFHRGLLAGYVGGFIISMFYTGATENIWFLASGAIIGSIGSASFSRADKRPSRNDAHAVGLD